MTTEPKPVKPLVAFAAVDLGGVLITWTMKLRKRNAMAAIGWEFPGGWTEAKRRGYRIVKVRIEPMEE